ncbi:MAG: molecular chaperone DnaJ [Synechococcaceae cyanobacterium RL_1_2]|nr:molecular chaperone DnaJ [Synechococcaceae cyanobacterium RL_1_2]
MMEMEMNPKNPYEQLGISENATFEDIQEAKAQLTEQYKYDDKAMQAIEAAYDSIFMERLRLRQEGRIKVPDGIRFAESLNEEARKKQQKVASSLPKVPDNWMQSFVDDPSQQELWVIAGVFGVLTLIAILGGPQFSALMMAGGLIASIYFLTKKENRFGRSLLIALGTFAIGIALGLGFANLITVGISVDQINVVVTLILLWLVSSFVR